MLKHRKKIWFWSQFLLHLANFKYLGAAFESRHHALKKSSNYHNKLFSTTPLDESLLERKEKNVRKIEFVSPKMQVFIEDTDAYGIIYNTNYLRSYDRALHIVSSDIENNPELKGIMSSQYEDWSIVSFTQQKFRSSPRLGEDYVIRGNLKQTEKSFEIWDMDMTSIDGEVVYNSISDLKISRRRRRRDDVDYLSDEKLSLVSPETLQPFQNTDDNGEIQYRSFSQPYTIYRDEIDAHLSSNLPLRNILNYFERCRTLAIGGPDELRRLQNDDGILAVVTTIRSCTLIDEGGTESLSPGQKIICESFAVPKRNGKIFECYQTLKDGENSRRIAQGQVNLMLIDSKTRKPVRNVPQRLLERFIQ